MVRGEGETDDEARAAGHDKCEAEEIECLAERSPCELAGWVELEGVEECDKCDSCGRKVEEEAPAPVVALLRENSA